MYGLQMSGELFSHFYQGRLKYKFQCLLLLILALVGIDKGDKFIGLRSINWMDPIRNVKVTDTRKN